MLTLKKLYQYLRKDPQNSCGDFRISLTQLSPTFCLPAPHLRYPLPIHPCALNFLSICPLSGSYCKREDSNFCGRCNRLVVEAPDPSTCLQYCHLSAGGKGQQQLASCLLLAWWSQQQQGRGKSPQSQSEDHTGREAEKLIFLCG